MKPELNGDLERFRKMAFVRAADCTEVIRRYHGLDERARQHPDYGLLDEVYGWVFVPLSIWPVDVRGLCAHLLEVVASGKRVKEEFRVNEYRNANGIIRRRMVQERNFRPGDWRFAWGTEAERFQNVFDAFCHRWNLYGMEGERPLLLKLSVNLTPFSTLIEVPKYWSFDPKRDLNWKAVTKLHRMREVKRQGPKLSPGRSARRDEAERARRFWEEAKRAGLKGERRKEWVMERLGWDARTDESKLRRLLGRGRGSGLMD